MNIEPALLITPFAAGLLVLATHVPLGREVLGRGIIFMDLAIAQIAGLGVIVAHLLHWESPWATQAAAGLAALLGALCLRAMESRWPEIQEALIGLLFVAAAAGSILLLASDPLSGEHMQDLLAGQILWISWPQLLPAAILTLPVLLLWQGARQRLGRTGFYVVFALTVTVSVQLVGVLLVFASLIAPAIAVRSTPRYPLIRAWALGALSYAAGLLISAVYDWPAGAAIVCCLVGMSFIALIMGSRAHLPASQNHPG